MNKKILKLWPVWVAISSALILAGIIVGSLLGFNLSPEKPAYKAVQINYDVRVGVAEKEEELQSVCEDIFARKGISYLEKEVSEEVGGTYLYPTTNMILTYTFSGSVSDEALEGAREEISAKVESDFTLSDMNKGIHVSVHSRETFFSYEAVWRAAVAVAVGAVVALVYLGIRFGIGEALTGLTVCVHDAALSVALLALCRIPVFMVSPLLIGTIAAFVSLFLWVLHCAKLRDVRKSEETASLPAEEALLVSSKNSFRSVLFTAVAIAGVIAVLGAVAANGVRLLVLPMLLAAAVPLYTALLFAPALHVHVKRAFDKARAKRKARYVGKKKGEKTEKSEEPKLYEVE